MCMNDTNWRQLWNVAVEHFRNGPLNDGSVHGPSHWKRVHDRGIMLAAATEGADMAVVKAFCILHDCQRENEWDDPEHGARAADVARLLAEAGVLRLWPEQIEKLCLTMRDHDKGETTTDPTIGCCWDADRLDLGRVAKKPDPAYMSTMLGRSAANFV